MGVLGSVEPRKYKKDALLALIGLAVYII